MEMNNQLAVIRMAGSMQTSAEVMKTMQNLIRVNEVAATMRELSKEMMKAGIIEEMLEDTMEGMEPEDMEEESEKEVEKILHEIIKDEIQRAPKAPALVQPAAEEEEEEEAGVSNQQEQSQLSLDQMRARLEALKS